VNLLIILICYSISLPSHHSWQKFPIKAGGFRRIVTNFFIGDKRTTTTAPQASTATTHHLVNTIYLLNNNGGPICVHASARISACGQEGWFPLLSPCPPIQIFSPTIQGNSGGGQGYFSTGGGGGDGFQQEYGGLHSFLRSKTLSTTPNNLQNPDRLRDRLRASSKDREEEPPNRSRSCRLMPAPTCEQPWAAKQTRWASPAAAADIYQ
jgi:hypothetical protein